MPELTALQLHTRDPRSLSTITNTEFLHLVRDDFSPELERLKRAYSVSSIAATRPPTPSPSHTLYGEDFPEINRTLVGVLALLWIQNEQYEAFVATQPDGVKLTRESFSWLVSFFISALAEPSGFYALLASMVTNDLGKDPYLARDYRAATGEDIGALNHDMILLRAADAGLIPCLDRLPPRDREDVVRGIRLGAEFNFAQLAQAENAPACLAPLAALRGHDRAFRLRFAEQLLDVAGAAGHDDWRCARTFVQPTFDTYRNMYGAATGVVSGEMAPREAYDSVLLRRAELLREVGFRAVTVTDSGDRAFLRVLCMGGATDLETANLYEAAWSDLEDAVRASLIRSLNVDGSVDEPAVQPTYIPALLSNAVGAMKSGREEVRDASLRSALCYLSRVMDTPGRPEGPVTVIERNVLGVLIDVVQSEEFARDPSILDSAPVPRGVAALTS